MPPKFPPQPASPLGRSSLRSGLVAPRGGGGGGGGGGVYGSFVRRHTIARGRSKFEKKKS